VRKARSKPPPGEPAALTRDPEIDQAEGFDPDDVPMTEHERFADLFHFGPVAYARLTPHGVIDDMNRAWRRLFARTASEMLGKPMVAMLAKESRAEFLEHMRRTRSYDGVVTTELSIDCRNGHQTPVVAYSSRSMMSHGMVCWTMLLDLTERVRLEEERRTADAQRLKAERDEQLQRSRSEAKDRFLAMLSHELRTPLTPALLAADRLLRETVDESVAPIAQVIKRNIEIEAQLINDLLDVTRIGHGHLDLSRSTIDLHEIIREAIDVCASLAHAKDIRIVTAFQATASVVEGDRTRLRQVFWNLLTNAIKFSQRGAIYVRTVDDESGSIRASVIDSGPGIDQETLSRIFRPFERGAESAGGLGLGLSICRGVVDGHGGRIWASSPGLGAGSTFEVELPTLTDAQLSKDEVTLPEPSSTTSRRILVIENDPDTAEMLSLLLRDDGHQVTTVQTLAAALAVVHDPWDVILSDLGLPDGNGLEVARAAKDRPLTPKLVAVSGFGSPQDLENSREAGFQHHLVKPIDFDKLRRLLK
jgi:PAS domain S-box-containing protein